MSYSAPNTPNPSGQAQIGFSFTRNCNSVQSGAANTDYTENTTIPNIPVGVWMITSQCFLASSTDRSMTSSTAGVFKNNDIIFIGGIVNTNVSLDSFYINPSGTFYSNGTVTISVQFTVRSSKSSKGVSMSGNIVFTKIA